MAMHAFFCGISHINPTLMTFIILCNVKQSACLSNGGQIVKRYVS
jgi:hypothetical protein